MSNYLMASFQYTLSRVVWEEWRAWRVSLVFLRRSWAVGGSGREGGVFGLGEAGEEGGEELFAFEGEVLEGGGALVEFLGGFEEGGVSGFFLEVLAEDEGGFGGEAGEVSFFGGGLEIPEALEVGGEVGGKGRGEVFFSTMKVVEKGGGEKEKDEGAEDPGPPEGGGEVLEGVGDVVHGGGGVLGC